VRPTRYQPFMETASRERQTEHTGESAEGGRDQGPSARKLSQRTRTREGRKAGPGTQTETKSIGLTSALHQPHVAGSGFDPDPALPVPMCQRRAALSRCATACLEVGGRCRHARLDVTEALVAAGMGA